MYILYYSIISLILKRLYQGIRQSQGIMDTCDAFMSDGLESVGMEEQYYPTVFTPPSQ